MTPRHVKSSKAHEGHVAVHAHGYTTPAREGGEREGVRLWRPASLRRLGTAGNHRFSPVVQKIPFMFN